MRTRFPKLRQRTPRKVQPLLECLEDRCVPALITVNDLGDESVAGDGKMTLREAIAEARFLHGDDTIRFQEDLSGTIQLSQGQLVIGNLFEGDRSGAVVIEAPSKDIRIDAGGASRVLEIQSNTVTLNGLTFQNGRHTGAGGNGGGIMIWDGFFGPKFENPAVVTMIDSKVIGNIADQGGGIYSLGQLMMTNVLVKGNAATNYGGGICINGGYVTTGNHLTAHNSTFSYNEARHGGGIFNDGGEVTLTGESYISNNTTTRFNGGGIYNLNGNVTLTGTTVTANAARNGGGVYNDHGTVELYSSTITGNQSSSGKGNDVYTNALDSVFSDPDSEIGDFFVEMPKSKGGKRK